ncbi:hypothetical protein [Aliifodinibius sp. S!AR15-10]|uniref:hypothetical protein n=1 Tax=Aliifodinibius sp. S!AR15-10 TaxID=2950437 RepID=UPI00286FB12B|nr:hypothetical protein [Aliifodinibius sp. S!AR15-10]
MDLSALDRTTIVLHGFLLARVIGDLIWWPVVRKIGSKGNVLGILLFLGASSSN